jgi:hypothetical protein
MRLDWLATDRAAAGSLGVTILNDIDCLPGDRMAYENYLK